MLLIQLWVFYHILDVIKAYDNLEGFFKLEEPCFEAYDYSECQSSIPEHFTATRALAGSNSPDTSVFLFTPSSRDKAEQLHKCGGYLPRKTTFDPTVPTEVIIHGWLDSVCRTAWMREMKEQLFERGKYNVILVDWTWGNTPTYNMAGLNSRVVGEQVGFVINNIMRQIKDYGPNKFHVIGHSFGAIASGSVGRSVKDLGRITALDPALAPFKYSPPSERLTHRDAKIVDVIHSNGADCWAFGIGDSKPLGHADFYVNGGSLQISCYPYILTALLKGDILYALTSLEPRICSHLQSLQYFIASINPKGCQFVGIASDSLEDFQKRRFRDRTSCSDWAVMGMDYEKYPGHSSKRKYFLTTRNTCPYYDNNCPGQTFPFNTTC